MVERFLAAGPMRSHPDDGAWVYYVDYAALEVRCREAEARVPLKGGIPLAQYVLQMRIEELEAAMREIAGGCAGIDVSAGIRSELAA